ncbi:3'-5' exonuclease [Desulfuromonas versatilis]|uniref:3'-5' exonuclease n=1 Tax=Desulfuromonas versatilis TaxID=2802975 RepID=UPI001C853B37|nr:3'-5' exonuclease [Desulfuromonas versatilis]
MAEQTQKFVFIDVETTGTNPESHGIVQISGCVQVGDEVRETFDHFVRPFPQDRIDDQALKVCGIDRRQLLPKDDPALLHVPGKEFLEPQEVFSLLREMLTRYVSPYEKKDKFQFVGYNAHSFDMPFVRRFWEKNNDRYFGSWFWYPCLDVMLVWAQILQPVREQLPNFRLATVARHCGIEVDDTRLHDSMYDIELTRALWLEARRIIEQGRSVPPPGTQGELFDF